MAKLPLKHYRKTFYKSPCEMRGYESPPKMITLTNFCKMFFVTKQQCMTLLKDKHLFGMTFRKNLFVCPCPLSHKWNKSVILEFWKEKK
jgi:hypothetical protein